MKKLIILIFCVFLLAFTLVNCTKENNSTIQPQDNSSKLADISQENSVDNSQEETKTAADFTTEELEEILFNNPSSAVLAKLIFHPANEMYLYFDGLGYLITDNDSVFNDYCKVADPKFPTYQSFINALNKNFTKKLVDELLALDYFIDVDGDLYTNMGARGTDIFVYNFDYSISYSEKDKIVFVATVTLLDPDYNYVNSDTSNIFNDIQIKTHKFEYVKIDNIWRFNNFTAIY